MNAEEYLKLANMTRNSELELILLYEERQRTQETQSHRAKLAKVELGKIVLALKQEVCDLERRIREKEVMYKDAKERNNVLMRENDEHRQMFMGSQNKVMKDYAELEKDSNSYRNENIRLKNLAERLQLEKDDAERQNRDLMENSIRITEQKSRLQDENSALVHENERLKMDMQVGNEKATLDIENARNELERRNRELECSNKKLGASLLNIELQYNDLLVKNAEILKNARAKENTGRLHAMDVTSKFSDVVVDSTKGGQKMVQKEDVVAILRELISQNNASSVDTLTSNDPEMPVYGVKQPKTLKKEDVAENKSATMNFPARGPGRPPGKRFASHPEKVQPKNNSPSESSDAVTKELSSSEGKIRDREVTSCANINAGKTAIPKSLIKKAGCAVADSKSMDQVMAVPKKRTRAGHFPPGSVLAQRLNVVKEQGAFPAKKAVSTMKDIGIPKKEISKIDNESFFANLTFSSTSPFFKK